MLAAAALLVCVAHAQQSRPEAPPEEDESISVREYSFNPLQAEKELKVGAFYMKKRSFRAAAGRFEEATRWNPEWAEAWFRLGEAQEKLAGEKKRPEERSQALEASHQAYSRYLELAPQGREAAAVRRKLARKP